MKVQDVGEVLTELAVVVKVGLLSCDAAIAASSHFELVFELEHAKVQ